MSSRFVVTRANWRRFADGVFRLPGTVDVAAFDTRAEADAECERREAEARGAINPFTWGDGLFDVTRLPARPLTDWLIEAGLSPPAADAWRPEQPAWWNGLEEEQRAAAWPAFDKLRLHAVEGRPRRPTLTVMSLIPWAEVGGETHRSANVEGGRLLAACTGWPATGWAAEVAAERYPLDYYNSIDTWGRTAFAVGPIAPSSPAPAYPDRVIVGSGEVPTADTWTVEYAATADDWWVPDRVPVVVRSAWRRVHEHGLWQQSSRIPQAEEWDGDDLDERTGVGLPLVAYPTREAAEADAWQRDLEARRYLNPFRFGPPQALTTVGEVGYRGVLRDLGLDLPDAVWSDWVGDQLLWAAWWEAAGLLLTDDQRETVWDLFDQLRFHQVVELEVRG